MTRRFRTPSSKKRAGPRIEQPIADVFDLVNEGIFTIFEDDSVHCNRSLREILNLPPGAVSSLDIIRCFEMSPNIVAGQRLTGMIRNGGAGGVTLSLPSKSGRERNLQVIIVGRTQRQNRTIAGMVREIASFAAIDESGAHWLFQGVFEGIEDGILILDAADQTIRRLNQAAVRILGTPPERLIGRPVLTLLADQGHKDEIADRIATKLPFLKSLHLDLEMLRANETKFPAFVGISEIVGENGDVIAWMWIVTDMTQRVSLNRALVDLEIRYRLLFDRTADPTLIIDSTTRKIIDANSAAEAQLGYRRSELIRLTMDDVTPESRRKMMEQDFTAMKVGESATIEGVNLTRSGDEIPVQISVVATDFEGRKVFIASCRDVSQQKILEQERLRVEKLDAVRKVAGGLAHEFSQPLQGLITIVDLMMQPGLSPDVQAELIKKIPPSVERMAVLLDQMKRIVRVETKPYAGNDDIVDIQHSARD